MKDQNQSSKHALHEYEVKLISSGENYPRINLKNEKLVCLQ